jgi:carboxyl-terminal processing protease
MSQLLKWLQLQIPMWVVLPVAGFLFVLGVGGGYLIRGELDPTYACTQSADICADFQNFWKTWDLVDRHFVDPSAIKPDAMINGAIEGMLDSLGDKGHTRYLPADVAAAERESLEGRFEGIGAYIDVRDEQPMIVQPIEGSPAEQAGIRAGDLILKVDGENVRGISVDELRNKVRGPKGTTVVLTVQHVGEPTPVDISIVRASINVPSVSWRMLPDNVAMIQLSQFASRSSQEMKQALTEAQAQGARAVILDLRNNPGGLVQELVGVASQFLPKGTTILLEQDRSGNRKPYLAEDGGVATSIPLVVLVNENSASSAEILAGALKEAERATVIGMPTYGTATVLRTYDLNDGAQVRIGTTQWLTPKGEVVFGVGIQPNEQIDLPPNVVPLSPSQAAELDRDALLQSEDVQLARALELLYTTANAP